MIATLAVGAPGRAPTSGHVDLYAVHGGPGVALHPIATLTDPAATAPAAFGTSVALNATATSLVVSAPNRRMGTHPGAGAALVYSRQGSTWTRTALLVRAADASYMQFGAAVAIGSGAIAVGVPHERTYYGGAQVITK